MGDIEMEIHDVESIKLIRSFASNGNSRTVEIKTKGGYSFQLRLYGKTDGLDKLEKSKNFVGY